MSKTWIIVAESGRARVFELVAKQQPLLELEGLLNPEASAHEADITADLPGKTVGVGGGMHTLQAEQSPKEAAADAFARRLAHKIDHARASGEVGNVLLACPPKFLGRVRAHLSEASARLVGVSLDKNLVGLDEAQIRANFF